MLRGKREWYFIPEQWQENQTVAKKLYENSCVDANTDFTPRAANSILNYWASAVRMHHEWCAVTCWELEYTQYYYPWRILNIFLEVGINKQVRCWQKRGLKYHYYKRKSELEMRILWTILKHFINMEILIFSWEHPKN